MFCVCYLCLVGFYELHVHLNLSAELFKYFWPDLSLHVSVQNRLAHFLQSKLISGLVGRQSSKTTTTV